jgi:beta-aspartyl-peptidase (threonine type)
MRYRVLVGAVALTAAACSGGSGPISETAGGVEWAIVVHGGAGVMQGWIEEEEHRQAYLEALAEAVEIGKAVLESGGSSLDAVERVVAFIEDDPKFNAGRGAVFNSDGGHELDASIMDGSTRACGAVAGVRTVKNPVVLARLVMESSKHVLFAGAGAERFADAMGVERVEPGYFHTERRHEQWRKANERERVDPEQGTGGAVALDRHGNLAAATSTGGLTNKSFGRVGDSPVIGAGTYADNATCAVSCTGVGEEFIRNYIAARVSALMEYRGMTLREAADHAVHQVLAPGDGGLIAVGHDGSIAMAYNTGGMFRGAADSTGRFEVGIWDDMVVNP